MVAAKKHHYVPQLLLRQWRNHQGLIPSWQWTPNGLLFRRCKPTEVMAEMHLYRMSSSPDPSLIENGFSRLESHAAEALRLLLDPQVSKLPASERVAWSWYLLSQRSRTPRRVAEAKKSVRKLLDDFIPTLEGDWRATMTGSSGFAGVEDFLRKRRPGYIEDMYLRVSYNTALDEQAITTLGNFGWAVRRDFPPCLMLGDEPIILDGQLKSSYCAFAIPLSPTTAFLASNDSEWHQFFQQGDAADIVHLFNQHQIKQSRRFLVGEVDRAYMEKHFPNRTIENLPPGGAIFSSW